MPAVVVAFFAWRGAYAMAGIVFAIAAAIVSVRHVSAAGRKAVDRFLGAFANGVGRIVGFVLLAPVFFVGMTLVRVVGRAGGSDPLGLRDGDATTFWHPCDSDVRRTKYAKAMFCTERLGRRSLSLLPVLVVVILVAAAAEIGLRIYGFGSPMLYVQDPDVGYYPKPSQRARYPGRVITVNQFGMRSPDVEAKKPAGRVRILMFGDSTLAGTRVSNAELYSSLLEDALNAKAGKKVFEVLNMGVNAWGPQHEAAFAKKFGTFDADVVMIMGPPQDVFRPRYGLERLPLIPAASPPRCALEEIFFEQAWRYRERKLGMPDWNFGPDTEHQTQLGIAAYGDLAALAKSNGGEVIAEMLPVNLQTFGRGEDTGSLAIFTRIKARLDAEGAIANLAGPIFRDEPDKGKIYYDGSHFDRLGHRLYAQYLAKRLVEVSPRVREKVAGP